MAIGCDDKKPQPDVSEPAVLAKNGDSGPGPVKAARDGGMPPGEPADHAVFHFVDNLLLAHHVRDGGLFIPGAEGAFAKYTRFTSTPRWQLGGKRDGHFVANLLKRASLEVPLTSRQSQLVDAVVLSIHAGRAARLTIEVNDESPNEDGGKMRLRTGWQEVIVPVEKGRLVTGANRLNIRYRSDHLEVRSIHFRLGQTDTDTDGTAEADSDDAAETGDAAADNPEADNPVADDPVADLNTDELFLPRRGGLSYFLHIPEKARLRGRVSPGCEVALELSAHDEEIAKNLGPGPIDVDLGAVADRVVQLSLIGKTCERATVKALRLTRPGPPTKPRTTTAPAPKYLVLWVMDTLRADRVRPFSPGARPEVPNFERLA
ncbi:MAG: hypothetical protein GY778_13795, partial [bacterium]|nr:hypothetical protein [bacterium]